MPFGACVHPARTLQWGHGGPAVDDTRSASTACRCCCRFNGATAVPPWMTYSPEWTASAKAGLQWGNGGPPVDDPVVGTGAGLKRLLQWGYGGPAVDDDWLELQRRERPLASMGPRRSRRG